LPPWVVRTLSIICRVICIGGSTPKPAGNFLAHGHQRHAHAARRQVDPGTMAASPSRRLKPGRVYSGPSAQALACGGDQGFTDFVGRMRMPLVAMGEEFTAGFGVDPQLQITRQMMDKVRTTQGGNQVPQV